MMSFKRKGQLTKSPERHKHLGNFLSRLFWKRERNAEKELIKEEVNESAGEMEKIDSHEEFEKSSGLKLINSENDLNSVLALKESIIYILVDWSGQERFSRRVICKTFNEINSKSVQGFFIDCSNQDKKYFENWLSEQQKKLDTFFYHGCGETILVKTGKVVDYIKYPGDNGLEKTKEKIESWMKST
jgi:hypothetical protein